MAEPINTTIPADAESAWRDFFGLAFIVVLAVMLLPAWGVGLELFESGDDSLRYASGVFDTVVNQLASVYLLPALGLCLVLRLRAVDLSVWAVSGLGGVLAAVLINAGVSVGVAFASAVGCGLTIGIINGLVVTRTRLPSIAVTLVTASLAVLVAHSLAPGREVTVAENTFSTWHLGIEDTVRWSGAGSSPGSDMDGSSGGVGRVVIEYRSCSPAITRMLLVIAAYSLVMIFLLVWGAMARNRSGRQKLPPGQFTHPEETGLGGYWARVFFHRPAGHRPWLWAAMAVSGALAATSGALWLIDNSAAPVPGRIIGDLRIIPAALLAGGALFVGPGRTLLTGLCLPAALLLATIWRQEIILPLDIQVSGYAVQSILLAVMVLSVQICFSAALSASGRPRRFLIVCLAAALSGVALVAMQASYLRHWSGGVVEYVGVIVWLTAMAILVIGRLRPRINKQPGG